ncbi:type II toxin-antitoxin system VapB family antitoxin [Thauera butanivorans]|jgi:antitoxin VapB|uniref:type II toxin-antitoxin system VapB family antitoxin n=1 Tax=Thauera butanivorans TaxID=86174 RepID=UPI000838D596|nr:type II toxin-antitoxin system VapB family antitoxin [Thauera butanivorans]
MGNARLRDGRSENQAIRLPVGMAYGGVRELEIRREGDVITLRPTRPRWESLALLAKTDADFLQERTAAVDDEGRFEL